MRLARQLQWLLALCLVLPCACQSPQGDAQKALAKELAARRQNRERCMRLYREGIVAREARRSDEAGKLLTEAVTTDKENVYAWMALGSVHYEREDYYKATDAFYQASRLAPTRYEPHFNMGMVLETAGRYNQAAQAYETALQLEPDQLEVMENLARTYVRSQRELQKAKALVERALAMEQRPEWRRWLELQSLRCAPATQPANVQSH